MSLESVKVHWCIVRISVDVCFKAQHCFLHPEGFLDIYAWAFDRPSTHICLHAFAFLPLQVHRMIAEFKLIPGLNNLFDKLIWRKHSASALVLHGHNQNCDCSPVSRDPDGRCQEWLFQDLPLAL